MERKAKHHKLNLPQGAYKRLCRSKKAFDRDLEEFFKTMKPKRSRC